MGGPCSFYKVCHLLVNSKTPLSNFPHSFFKVLAVAESSPEMHEQGLCELHAACLCSFQFACREDGCGYSLDGLRRGPLCCAR